jgi:hypothetical protein
MLSGRFRRGTVVVRVLFEVESVRVFPFLRFLTAFRLLLIDRFDMIFSSLRSMVFIAFLFVVDRDWIASKT